jgi:hypothetical protein
MNSGVLVEFTTRIKVDCGLQFVVLGNILTVFISEIGQWDICDPLQYKQFTDDIWDLCKDFGSNQAWYHIWELLVYQVATGIQSRDTLAPN